MPSIDKYHPKDVEANRAFAALSYLGPLVLIPRLSTRGKSSPFTRFHATQGMYLFLCELVLAAVMIFLGCIRVVDLYFGVPIRSYIPWPALVGVLVLACVGIVPIVAGVLSALRGKVLDLPLISKMRRLGWFK